jgi:propanol-preferring alcohol dehydrogenase
VAAVDCADRKLKLAGELGARFLWRQQDNLAAELRRCGGTDGVQCVFDCVGTAATLSQACSAVMNIGRVVVIGEEGGALSMTSTAIAQREIEILGSRNGTRQDMAEAIQLVERGQVRPPIAARFPLSEANAAISALRAGPMGRVVVNVA